VTTQQIANKIVELYWPHSVPFVSRVQVVVLKQNRTGQAEIMSEIVRFRARHGIDSQAEV